MQKPVSDYEITPIIPVEPQASLTRKMDNKYEIGFESDGSLSDDEKKLLEELDQYERERAPINWDVITKNRYIDWAITTPMMLLVLCIFLASESKTVVHLTTIVLIMIFNYLMLYIGYLGETKALDRFTACIGGFVQFFIVFYLIFTNFVVISKGMGKYWLFLFYLVFWSLYGLVYLLEESYKNIAMNILDCIAKCLVGISLWVYYVKIIPQY